MLDVYVLNFLIVLWLLIALAGRSYSRRLKVRAQAALAWLREHRLNGAREIVISGAVYRGQLRILIFDCMMTMGLIAFGLQFIAAGSDWRSLASGVFRLVMLLMGGLLFYKTYLEDNELDLVINESQRHVVAQRSPEMRTRSTDEEG